MQMKICYIPLLQLLLFTASCSPILTKTQCQQGDWYAIGYNDGVRGLAPDNITRYFSACKEVVGSRIDANAYSSGWQAGIKIYCRPANGYTLGIQGTAYQGQCLGQSEEVFLGNFVKGLAIYTMNTKMAVLYSEIDQLHKRLDYTKQQNEEIFSKIRLSLKMLRVEIAKLKTKKDRITR